MSDAALSRPQLFWQVVRYGINGVVATAVHYTALRIGLETLHIPSAGLANFLAALFGIAVSFVGSRYFVFLNHTESFTRQAARFLMLYLAIACMHMALLFVWTDLCHLDYTVGFAIAIVIQVTGSYFGNRYLVFAK